jgi:hypothetical protein
MGLRANRRISEPAPRVRSQAVGQKFWRSGVAVLALATLAWAKDPIVSGPKVGSQPGMYPVLLSTGANRGQSKCLFCETGDRPAVVVFARSPNEALGKLATNLDKAIAEHKAAGLRSWVAFISKDQEAIDPQLVRWSKQHGLRSILVGTYVDPDEGGPENYQLAREADVTVVLLVKQTVLATFAFRAGQLTDDASQRVLQAVPRLLDKKP